jgi:hypothetical protein
MNTLCGKDSEFLNVKVNVTHRNHQCFSWVGTAFPQIFPFALIFVKVEITPPVYYATS